MSETWKFFSRYKSFEDLYGKDTTDDDRPSKKKQPESEQDKKHKNLFVAGTNNLKTDTCL